MPFTFRTSQSLSWQAPAAFQVATIPGVIADKAYAGFTASVWSLTQKNFSLSKHAEIVYSELAGGKRIAVAVKSVNDQTQPVGSKGQSLRMVVRGDLYAKIVNVYQNETELGQENRSGSWYWVKN